MKTYTAHGYIDVRPREQVGEGFDCYSLDGEFLGRVDPREDGPWLAKPTGSGPEVPYSSKAGAFSHLARIWQLKQPSDEPFPERARYTDCHDDQHEVRVVARLDPTTYVIEIDQDEHGCLVATDVEGREWWDGNALVVNVGNLDFEREETNE